MSKLKEKVSRKAPQGASPVVLVIKDYPFTPVAKPLRIKWTSVPVWINEDLLKEKDIVFEAGLELRNEIYKIQLNCLRTMFEIVEQRRLDKINLFMKQTGAWK